MDLRLLASEPTQAEREAIDVVVGAPEPAGDRIARTGHEARGRRHLLLPALRAAQRRVGWVSEGALGYVCRRLDVPPADAYGVASFYALLSLEPRPERVLHVCDDLACRLEGVPQVEGEHVIPSPCLGLCDRAPAALLTIAGDEPEEVQLAPYGAPAEPVLPQRTLQQAVATSPELRLLRRIGVVDPESLDDYLASGGWVALQRAHELGPEGVIREVGESGLVGRGGAAFPTGRKWEAVAAQEARPHYLVCNADESEPGTFKDRVLMEGDPFAVLEAMAITAFATGCKTGYVYLRGEYPLAHARLENAIGQARGAGLLDGFEVEIRVGAGAYICGEETALFNSIEGRRGEPRNKPPFPAEVGLHGQPTVVNNVETLVNVLDIVREGGADFAETETRLFCLSGHVDRPGLYEVPVGTTLREVLSLAGAQPVKAVLLGGAAGSFLGPDDLDLPLTFEDTRAAGATLGSGVVMVFGEGADLTDAVLRIASFFRDESCGQCVPCRVGTVRQEEALHRLAAGRARGSVADEVALLEELAQVMRDASICGLGQTAANAVMSAVERLGVPAGSPA
jgi:NADH-quinone oxidoreductase subunit F